MSDLFDLTNGITAGVLRLGIAQGDYVAYVEVADSGIGFQYFVRRVPLRCFASRVVLVSLVAQTLRHTSRARCTQRR